MAHDSKNCTAHMPVTRLPHLCADGLVHDRLRAAQVLRGHDAARGLHLGRQLHPLLYI